MKYETARYFDHLATPLLNLPTGKQGCLYYTTNKTGY